MAAGAKAQRTRSKIREAAVETFFYYGYGGTGLREIADLAGINPATIYYHYRSKEHLLVTLVEDLMADLSRQAEHVARQAAPPEERLRALIQLHVEFHCERAEEATIADREINAVPIRVRRKLVEMRDAYERLWTQVIDDGMREGVFACNEPTLARLAILGATSYVMTWYRSNRRLSPSDIACEYGELMLRLLQFPQERRPNRRRRELGARKES